MTQAQYTKRLTVTVFALMAIIGAIGFALSYEALMNVAQTHGKPDLLGMVWPLIIDVPIVAFSLAAVIATANNKPAMTPRAVVVLATAATIAYNWFHAYSAKLTMTDNIVSITVAVMAPVMYFLSFEVSLWLIGIIATPQTVTPKLPTVTKPAPTVTPVTQPAKLSAQQRRAKLPAVAHLGADALAERWGVSVRTVWRDAEAVGVTLNGKG